MINGDRRTRVNELLTVAEEHTAQWTRSPLNLSELAALRMKGLCARDLARHFGCGKTKIQLELRRLGVAELRKKRRAKWKQGN